MASAPEFGILLRLYLAAVALLTPLAGPILRRRLSRGKEDSARWREKLGEATAARPDGRLVWLHAVGLGEVLALRGLILAMQQIAPDLSFLITSTARSSAEVIAANLPPRTRHQFLPVDVPSARRRFLDHWRPDLSIWAEQDMWPGLVADSARRGIPLALVNARMDRSSFQARNRVRGLYASMLQQFALLSAQEAETAKHLGWLGAQSDIMITGSMKPAAPPLSCDQAELTRLQAHFAGRKPWLCAPSHAEDEAIALAAQKALWTLDHRWLLIVAPRIAARGPEVSEASLLLGLPSVRRSQSASPKADMAVYVADTMGEMGLWYRLVRAALIGGTFGSVEGHNPWEAVSLSVPVLHGPRLANFRADYALLGETAGTTPISGADDLTAALLAEEFSDQVRRAYDAQHKAAATTIKLATDLVALVPAS